MNRVLIFPERVYAFPHLRKSITPQVPWFPVLAPSELISFTQYNADTIVQFQIVACGLIALNAAHVAVLRGQPYFLSVQIWL